MQAFWQAVLAAGSMGELADRIGVARSTPSMWAQRGKVPGDHCPAIERETGVRCEALRPDIPWGVLRRCSCGSSKSKAEAT